MLKAILLPFLMVTVLLIGGSRNAAAMSLDLSQFQWKNRLLFLFAPNHNHPMFETLHNSLTAQELEVADRDLVIFKIFESGRSTMNMQYLDPQTAQSLRQKFNVSRGQFSVILVGKDGGIKLKRQDDIHLTEIFDLIDAMPMRQQETRQKNRPGGSDSAATNESGGIK